MLHTLQTFLKIADKIIPRKSEIEVLKYLCVQNGKIKATDLQTFIKMPIKDNRHYLLPLTLVKKVLSLKPNELKIELLPDHKINILFDQKKLSCKTIDPIEFPGEPEGKFKKVAVWPEKVLKQLQQLTPFISDDETNLALTSVFITQKDSVSAVATDGHILQWNTDLSNGHKIQSIEPFNALIPGKALKAIGNFLHGPVQVFLSDQYIRFVSGHRVDIAIRLIDEAYVNYQSVIPQSFSNILTINRIKLLQIISEMKKLTPFINHHINLSGTNGKLQVTSSNFDLETLFEVSLPVHNQNETSYKASFDLELLGKILKVFPDEQITWAYTDMDSPHIFYGNSPIKCLLMPLRGGQDDE